MNVWDGLLHYASNNNNSVFHRFRFAWKKILKICFEKVSSANFNDREGQAVVLTKIHKLFRKSGELEGLHKLVYNA